MKKPICALVVEDDASWRQVLKEILEDAGLEVELAANIPEAANLASRRAHRLAIIDLSLRESDPHNRDGLTVAAELRNRDPGCVTILLTGYATVEVAVQALTELSVYTFLQKENFQRESFKALIRRVLSLPGGYALPQAKHGNEEFSVLPGSDDGQAVQYALLVEDDAGWREILQELLEEAGYIVRACASAGEAFGWWRRYRFQLAVIDLSLNSAKLGFSASASKDTQELEGFQLLDWIETAKIPVIVVSGAVSLDEIIQIYRRYSLFAFVEKPTFDRGSFLRLLAEAKQSQSEHATWGMLTEREVEVLKLLATGMTNKEIGRALVITPNTVKRHIKAIFRKLDVHTRSAAASKALAWAGMVRPENHRERNGYQDISRRER